MDYRETLDYLFAQLPMFHRIGPAAYKGNLDNTHAFCKLLRHPENNFRSIHVAGTNGKGSVSHMLAAILQSAGYKTGLYTSPHLVDFRERIRINGEMIPEEEVCAFVASYREDFEKINLSFFEWTVGLAFDYFSRSKVEIAVIETGLGGRLDSTNVISPLVSVITNIGMDHTALLGDTLEKIAREKAGIIKPGTPVVIGEAQEEIAHVFTSTAQEKGAPFIFASLNLTVKEVVFNGRDYRIYDIYHGGKLFLKNLKLDLTGFYQSKNILTVIQSVLKLQEAGFVIGENHIRSGLENTCGITGLKGRWQILSDQPLTICDVGHNVEGVREVVKQLNTIPHDRLHFVIGFVKDKDIVSILRVLPKNATYYFCSAHLPRSLSSLELKNSATVEGLTGEEFNSVQEAFDAARNAARQNDLIFIGGSTFVVGELIESISERVNN